MDWVGPVGVTFSKENDGDMHDLGKCRPTASPAHPSIALMTKPPTALKGFKEESGGKSTPQKWGGKKEKKRVPVLHLSPNTLTVREDEDYRDTRTYHGMVIDCCSYPGRSANTRTAKYSTAEYTHAHPPVL